jgi:hypothetical protein
LVIGYRNPEGVVLEFVVYLCGETLSGLRSQKEILMIPWLPKLNPGLKLANTFGVNRMLD